MKPPKIANPRRIATVVPCPDAVLVRRARRAIEMTQQELARALDVSDATLCRWERGTGTIPDRAIAKAMSILGITPDADASADPTRRTSN